MKSAELIERNIRAHTSDGFTSWHMVASAHERTIRDLCADLAVLRGEGQTEQIGCDILPMILDGTTVPVEFDQESGEAIGVFVGGMWIDAACFSPGTLEFWGEQYRSREPYNARDAHLEDLAEAQRQGDFS